MHEKSVTLGDALAQRPQATTLHPKKPITVLAGYHFIKVLLLTALTTTPLWWVAQRPKPEIAIVLMGVLVALWLIVAYRLRKIEKPNTRRKRALHPLLAHDRQGFMASLNLAQKTAIFDGSNLYHFGLKEDLGTQALALIARQLRADGYRIISFFDANIHFTLTDHGHAPKGERHSIETLERSFGLRPDEIYVVPSGTQADKFILDSLKHLPTSFAVTNDRFRDYAKAYSDVMRGDQWSKGVTVTKNEIRIIKHRFSSPVYLSQA